MSTCKRSSGMKYADENIRKYYKCNEVERFAYSRPYHQDPRDSENEFASLWLDRYTLWTAQSFPGIMGWFPVERQISTKVSNSIVSIGYIFCLDIFFVYFNFYLNLVFMGILF